MPIYLITTETMTVRQYEVEADDEQHARNLFSDRTWDQDRQWFVQDNREPTEVINIEELPADESMLHLGSREITLER